MGRNVSCCGSDGISGPGAIRENGGAVALRTRTGSIADDADGAVPVVQLDPGFAGAGARAAGRMGDDLEVGLHLPKVGMGLDARIKSGREANLERREARLGDEIRQTDGAGPDVDASILVSSSDRGAVGVERQGREGGVRDDGTVQFGGDDPTVAVLEIRRSGDVAGFEGAEGRAGVQFGRPGNLNRSVGILEASGSANGFRPEGSESSLGVQGSANLQVFLFRLILSYLRLQNHMYVILLTKCY